jgi:hypothetical protein
MVKKKKLVTGFVRSLKQLNKLVDRGQYAYDIDLQTPM